MVAPNLTHEDIEVRCPGGLLGILKEDGLEVKCRHWRCNQGDTVTYHTIDSSGKIIATNSYKDPNKEKK